MAITKRSSGEQVGPIERRCKRCGCCDIRKSRHGEHCRHCGKAWIAIINTEPKHEEQTKGVIYQIIKCPSCDSEKTRVTKTVRPVRYHKCKDCGHNFKSMEQVQ